MTDNNHPITPPPELIEEWIELSRPSAVGYADPNKVATLAARWGADQELEACREVLARELICDGKHVATDLRAARRPKPTSLKEQALEALDSFEGFTGSLDEVGLIRRALEQLND